MLSSSPFLRAVPSDQSTYIVTLLIDGTFAIVLFLLNCLSLSVFLPFRRYEKSKKATCNKANDVCSGKKKAESALMFHFVAPWRVIRLDREDLF